MINYIIVDDISFFLTMVEKNIDKIMFEKNNKYKVYKFESFNEDFWSLVNKKLENVFYILDIEVKDENGITAARKIRELDKTAEILFMTVHDTEEYKYIILTGSIKQIGFISKVQLAEKLFYKINEFVHTVNDNAVINFKENGVIANITLDSILYLNTADRTTKIHVLYNTFESYKGLSFYEKILNEKSNNFVRTHRNCVVNIKNVKYFDFKNKEILFRNNKKINLLSSKYKKEIENKFNKTT